MKRNLDMACMEAQKYLADRAQLDLHAKSLHQEHKRQTDTALRNAKDKDSVVQKLKDMGNARKAVEMQIPALVMSKENLAGEIHVCDRQRKKLLVAIEELKREEDICMSAYLKVGNGGRVEGGGE